MAKTKEKIGFKNTLFLIIGILLIILLILKIIEKDIISIAILTLNSILVSIVFLILKKQEENMIKALDEDLNTKLEEIKNRGKKAKK